MTIDSGLAAAQRAIELPEVQELVKQLAAYGLGVFVPHIHDAAGNMLPLPEGIVQVEDDLVVSFKSADQVRDTQDAAYVTVGWGWSASGPGSKLVCKIEKQSDGNYRHIAVQQSH